jgi:methionine aminotransferase
MPEFSGSLRSKLPRTGTTIFTEMGKLAVQQGAINLSQGFPDFSCDERLVHLVSDYMHKGFNQYAPMEGLMSLREQIAKKTEELYSAKYHPETEITITAGATQAIYTAIGATVGEGDEVIIFTPAYDCYAPAVELNGGKPIYVQLEMPDYSIDWEQVKKVINQRTKLIILNTPHNPTGAIFSMEDMAKLEKLISNSDIMVVSDEVYEHIIFDGYEHQSVARFPKLAERSFIISSFGKTYHVTGWKVGYCLAPKNLMKEFRKAHQYIVFAVNTPIQHAYSDYLNHKEAYLGLREFYTQKRNFFNNLLKGSRFTIRPSSGTYFQLLGYEKITEETDTDFAIRLTKKHKVAAIPVSVFYHKKVDDKVLRFCFAKDETTLQQAAEILHQL